MYKEVKHSDNIYFIGVNDRRTALFENTWLLDRGIPNPFVIKDDKTAVSDTIKASVF
jgi:flavorubredoxin